MQSLRNQFGGVLSAQLHPLLGRGEQIAFCAGCEDSTVFLGCSHADMESDGALTKQPFSAVAAMLSPQLFPNQGVYKPIFFCYGVLTMEPIQFLMQPKQENETRSLWGTRLDRPIEDRLKAWAQSVGISKRSEMIRVFLAMHLPKVADKEAARDNRAA